jgi:hypothetical protein
MWVPYFNPTTSIDPHLDHEVLGLGKVQHWIREDVLMANHGRHMAILGDASDYSALSPPWGPPPHQFHGLFPLLILHVMHD